MKPLAIRWGRVARLMGVALAAVAILLLAVLVVAARQYAYGFTHTGCIGPLANLDEQGYRSEAVSFPSRLGYTLRGWYAPGNKHPEIAIVALPGASGNSYFALPDAAMLAEAGYSTLVYEHRSCVNPSLIHSGGYFESFDLLGAVDYLKSRPDVQRVGVLGFSTGGSTAIIAAGQHPGIEATVALGGYASLASDALDPDEINTPLDWIVREMVLFFLSSEQGIPLDQDSPVSYVGRISPRPILLIYGELEARAGHMLYDAARQPAELWIVPGVDHGGYRAAFPDEYRRRILEFFGRAFGG